MKTLIPLFVLSAALAAAAPAIRTGGVYNAASYIPLGMPGSGIAQGSYFVIFGSGLGPATIAIAPSLNFTTTVAGTSVSVTPSSGAPVQAFLYYASDGQVSGILPSGTPAGAATVTVSYNGATSAPAPLTVVRSNFGILTFNQAGSGPAAILNFGGDNAGINSLTNAASNGQVLVLFGTGLGGIDQPDNAPPGAVSPANLEVRVLIGNQSVAPQYAGRAPQYPGEDQINFQLPPNVPDGCFIPIAVQVNGVVSNYATFAKTATGGRCSTDLPATALDRLDRGGTITVGQLSLLRSNIVASVLGFNLNITTDQAGGVFTPLTGAGFYGLTQTPAALPPLNPAGTCFVQTIESTTPPSSAVPPVATALDAGPLTLTGPNNKMQTLPFTAGRGYLNGLAQSGVPSFLTVPLPGVPTVPAGSPASYIEPGQWSVKGNGGPDIGPFTASITVPAPFNCTNCAQITAIDRSKPLTITWTGGGGDKDYVQIGGTATAPSLADSKKNVAVVFSCSAKATDGTLTIPAGILSQMPTSSADLFADNTGALVVVNGLGLGNGAFTAPLKSGGNLDLGYFGYASALLKAVGYL